MNRQNPEDKPKHMTSEEIKAEVAAEVDGYYGIEYGRAIAIAERIRAKFFGGGWWVNPQTRHICFGVWAWFANSIDYTFFKAALDDVFSQTGFYVYSFNRGRFWVDVEVTERPAEPDTEAKR